MNNRDFTEDRAAQLGAGMCTVALFGKTAVITQGITCVAGAKAGVIIGGFLCPPAAIAIGTGCICAGLVNYFGKRNWW